MALVLASASPRRAELLQTAGFSFDVRPVDVDESRLAGESPETYVRRVALDKARVAAVQYPGDVVLAADTTVVIVDAGQDASSHREILGKPSSREDAARMLRQLQGRMHEVLTGVALAAGERASTFVETTRVWFAPMSEANIAWYLETGESMDKAGAYAIQGLASRFVRRIEGSYSNVVGLPVAQVAEALDAFMNGR